MDLKIKRNELMKFSLIWSVIFAGIGFYPLLVEREVRYWAFGVAFCFFLIALIKPGSLHRFYCLWTKLGNLIGGVISRIVLFIIYFGVFTPVSFGFKILGKDPLNRKLDKSVSSHWIDRDTQPQSMKNQF